VNNFSPFHSRGRWIWCLLTNLVISDSAGRISTSLGILLTDLLAKKTTDNQWQRAGPSEILVEPTSAIQRGTKESDQYSINKDHSNLVKFAENEDALGPILHFIRLLYDSLKDQGLVRENVRANAPTLDGSQTLQNTPVVRENGIVEAEAQKKQMRKKPIRTAYHSF
jgi:hypothetical protein